MMPPFRPNCSWPLWAYLPILLIAVSLLCCGCTYLEMTVQYLKMRITGEHRTDAADIKQAQPEKCGVIMGRMIGKLALGYPVVVAAVTAGPEASAVADYTVLPSPGPYMLYVPKGRYHILAFADYKKDVTYDVDNLIGRYAAQGGLTIAAGQVCGGLDILLDSGGVPAADFKGPLRMTSKQRINAFNADNNTPLNLDDRHFARQFGTLGLWEPSRFINTVGVNIYCLKPYQASKIPVLFIHGSGGTPRDLSYIAGGIDSRRFQALFFYYPSGLRLQTLADLLYEKLDLLHERYGFHELSIVAHSMGGLIVRAYLETYARRLPNYRVKHFASLSTPWGGIERAGLAPTRSVFKYPPCWKDLSPQSPFIRTLFHRPLPPGIRFILCFGYKSDNLFLKGDNDGSISLKSLLDFRAQSEAAKCFGFDENHVSILFSPDIMARCKAILSES